MFLSNFSQRLKFSISVQHIDESCPRLSTQVVFTAAFLKIPLTCLSCSCLLSLVRGCANCCGVVSALESSLKERALEQGATTTLSRCLVLRLVSSLGAKSLAHRLALSFYIFHSQPLTCLRCESRKKCLRKKTPLRMRNGNRFISLEPKERSSGSTSRNRSLDTSG